MVSILWQLPAYVVITLAEILLSVSGPEFAYQEVIFFKKCYLQAKICSFIGVQRTEVGCSSDVVAYTGDGERHRVDSGWSTFRNTCSLLSIVFFPLTEFVDRSSSHITPTHILLTLVACHQRVEPKSA